ncbi:hypothetical protein H6F67_26260 [Microcoleus sp. FACHB-1515]|uniref:hypothetical protein n=1 Tax=Cyanophyceae TaxID=3028117 RepID=UPI001686AF55|nr:hypothetical protein [Microcoleus sp. FACHB-1515]MBD2093353.1 hypothetical protein [Microcoleus sp. FACHB-1515]
MSRPVQKRFDDLDSQSWQTFWNAKKACPFWGDSVKKRQNELNHHVLQVNELQQHPGYSEFLQDNQTRVNRLHLRNELSGRELRAKNTVNDVLVKTQAQFSLPFFRINVAVPPQLPSSDKG